MLPRISLRKSQGHITSINTKTVLSCLSCLVIGYFLGSNQGGRPNNTLVQQCVHTMSFKNGKSPWDVVPLEHTERTEIANNIFTDAFNPLSNYMSVLSIDRETDFPNLPQWHTWVHYLEAYHNHLYRFRGQNVVFMEVGVQSGGKIAAMRDYIGPGFKYIGIDVNPSVKSKFESADWINIEIGSSENVTFLRSIKIKYPHVDVFLDDGGHTMNQQMVAFREMLPHVQKEGVYICEDLETSWRESYGGINGDVRNGTFLHQTMVGLVHQTMDWLNSHFINGNLPDDYFGVEYKSWWRTVPDIVKHIHFYNQLIVYEKGETFKPIDLKTVGEFIPYQNSGTYVGTDWVSTMKKIKKYTNSPWPW